MSRFSTPLEVRVLRSRTLVRRPLYLLTAPLTYDSDLVGRIVVPAQFRTDFASIPILPVLWGLFGDVAHYAAVVHDWIYHHAGQLPGKTHINRATADQVFEEAMALDVALPEAMVSDPAVPWAPRRVIYQAVRLGGRYRMTDETKEAI